MNKTLLAAGILGASAVALGAYAAHGLQGDLAGLGYSGEALERRVENFETGARHQLLAAAALLAMGLAPHRKRTRYAAAALAAGALVFCGLLYVLAFAGEPWRWLGAVVPLGGLSMIIAWGLIATGGYLEKKGVNSDPEETTKRGLGQARNDKT